MTTYEIEQSARSLFDGGWRAEDKEQLIAEYDLTEAEAVEICEWLEKLNAFRPKDYTVYGVPLWTEEAVKEYRKSLKLNHYERTCKLMARYYSLELALLEEELQEELVRDYGMSWEEVFRLKMKFIQDA